MAFHYLNVIVASVLFLAIIPQVDANAAYVYYEDAQCTSGGYIKGKLIFAFDTYTMKGNGFTIKKYEGPCKYFENGRHDLEYNNGNDGSFMKNGYCITCNGQVGCTSTRYSCKYFSTTIPSNPYTMSDTSNSTDDFINDVDNGAEDDGEDNEDSSQIQQFQDSAYQEVVRYDNATFSTGYYSLLGVFGAMFLMVALFRASRAIRRLQRKSVAIDASTLVGDIEPSATS